MNKLYTILALVIFPYIIYGAHIIGGDITYKCIMIDSDLKRSTFEITMQVYRDSKGGGAILDDPARFGIFRGIGLNWEHIESRNIFLESAEDITNSADPCIIIPSNIGVEKGVYRFEIVLPWSDETYKIAYQRCCRNNTISNLVNPGETGAVFEVNILPDAQKSCNNSPTFDNFPPIVVCAGVNLNASQSATDSEGDQLIYEFCAPIQAGGTDGATTSGDPESCTGVMPNPVNCRPPFEEVEFATPTYTPTNPMGTLSGITINPNTGLLTGKPSLVGQFVVGVCVKEFRNGKLIGEIRRDFQFNVATCQIAVQAGLIPETEKTKLGDVTAKSFEIISCGPTELFIKNTSTEEENIISYLWEMDINGQTESLTTKDATFSFPGLGKYNGRMILNPGIAACSDTADLVVNIHESIDANFDFQYDTCVAGPIDFEDLSTTSGSMITTWEWDFGNGESSSDQNPQIQLQSPGDQNVTLAVTDQNNCADTIMQDISWNPTPDAIIIDPSQFIGCNPSSIFFNNLSSPINEDYIVEWDFGDGESTEAISPTHKYTNTGIFSVNVSITSPIGCKISRSYTDLIEIKPKPTADYTYSPDFPSSFRKEITFNDQSTDAINWSWRFDDIGAAFIQNPTFNFPDTGVYNVDLIVVNNFGCSDTATQVIDIKPIVTLQIPNAFTPNNDGLNDVFKPVGILDGIRDYELIVWNRWGEMIFESRDPNIGWNGEYKNNGTLNQEGVYVYTIKYISPRGEPKNNKGHITLIR